VTGGCGFNLGKFGDRLANETSKPMPPLLEKMARDALIARVERAEQALASNQQAIASLTQALWHHIERRHDTKVGSDDMPAAANVRAARRILTRGVKKGPPP